MDNQQQHSSKLVLFAFCTAIAVLIWLASNFSDTYKREYTMPISYENVPSRLAVETEINELRVSLEATGWQLLVNNFKNSKVKVDLAGQESGTIRIFGKEEVARMMPDVQIFKVLPDIYNFELVPLDGKLVPVEVVYEKDLALHYFIAGDVKSDPDSVLLSGSKDVLDTIEKVTTELVKIKGKEAFQQSVKLNGISSADAGIDEVLVSCEIEEFTEVTYGISIVTENAPEGIDFMIYPETVTVSFLVPFSKYDLISANDLKVVVDFDKEAVDESKEIKLSLKMQPSFIKNVQISPEVVNLVLYK